MNLRIATPLAVAMLLGSAGIASADAFKPSKADQVKLGKQAAAEIRREEKVLPSRDIRVQTVRRVGNRLLSQMDDQREPWEYSFDVIDNKEVNAFALPGGPVFFYTGLLDRLQTEDQLAAIMAHELTHVRREHWAYAYADQQKRQLGLSLLLIFTRANRTVADLASIGNDLLVTLPFSRKHEHEADDQGLSLLLQAGYNPNGMPQVFEILQQAGGSRPPEFLSTHPDNSNRISRLNNKISGMSGNFPAQRALPWK